MCCPGLRFQAARGACQTAESIVCDVAGPDAGCTVTVAPAQGPGGAQRPSQPSGLYPPIFPGTGALAGAPPTTSCTLQHEHEWGSERAHAAAGAGGQAAPGTPPVFTGTGALATQVLPGLAPLPKRHQHVSQLCPSEGGACTEGGSSCARAWCALCTDADRQAAAAWWARPAPVGYPQVAACGHGSGSQGIAAGPRVHPDPPPHPTGPGRPAPAQAPQAAHDLRHTEGRIPEPRLPEKPWPACDPAPAAAAEEAAERGTKGALGGSLGVLGYTYNRHISVNWCVPSLARDVAWHMSPRRCAEECVAVVGVLASNRRCNVVSALRAWMCGRLAWGLFLFYLATLGFYLYVRLTSTLDLGLHYQWCAPRCACLPVF